MADEEEEAAAKVVETAVLAAHDLERVAAEVAQNLGRQISAALVAAAQQVEVAVEMVRIESEARKEAMGQERKDRRRGLLWMAAPMVVAFLAASLAVGGYFQVRRESKARVEALQEVAETRIVVLCEQQNRTNMGTLALLNALLDLASKRDGTLTAEQLPLVLAGRAEARATGARMLAPADC